MAVAVQVWCGGIGMHAWAPQAAERWATSPHPHPLSLLLLLVGVAVGVSIWWMGWRRRRRKVFLVDFACYKPRVDRRCNYEVAEYFTRSSTKFTLPSMYFQKKVFLRSGIGEETCFPAFVFEGKYEATHADALHEAQEVMVGCVSELLHKTAIKPHHISILITNSSLFSPVPSYASMLVNHFKMSPTIKSFHLSGMGCSASVIACALAKDLLQLYPRQYALIVSSENITLNWYFGNNKPMLLTNCLFRVGCAAILLTNRESEKGRSNYELQHYVRTHTAADDTAYKCAFQTVDEEGLAAVVLTKGLMETAAWAIRENMMGVGPLVLPISEQLAFAVSLVAIRLLKMKINKYQPDFKLAFQHFCFHPGGKSVIDSIQKNMHLNDYLLEPSRATLHQFGNTSASCVWYTLGYMEAKQRVKQGDKVWMLGLGSGFKCNSAIWKALRDIPMPIHSPWLDCIHRYPTSLLKAA